MKFYSEKRSLAEGQPIKFHDGVVIFPSITFLVFRLLKLENEVIHISSHWPRVMQEWRPCDHFLFLQVDSFDSLSETGVLYGFIWDFDSGPKILLKAHKNMLK